MKDNASKHVLSSAFEWLCLCVKQDKVLKPRLHEVIHQISVQGSSSECHVVMVTVTLRPEPATSSSGSSTTLQAHTLLMHSQSTPIFPSLQGAWSNRQLENALPAIGQLTSAHAVYVFNWLVVQLHIVGPLQ
jgi:hypothetical protein